MHKALRYSAENLASPKIFQREYYLYAHVPRIMSDTVRIRMILPF